MSAYKVRFRKRESKLSTYFQRDHNPPKVTAPCTADKIRLRQKQKTKKNCMSVNKSGFIWRKEMTVPFWNYNFQILHLLIALIKFLIVKSMDQKTRLFKSLADI